MAKKLFWRFCWLGALMTVLSCLIYMLYGRLFDGLPHFGVRQAVFLVSAAGVWVLVLSVLARRLTQNIVNPLVAVAGDADESDADDLVCRAPYPELTPFIEALQRRQVQKEENVRQRQEFSANVTHELKTPLTSISGYAEMIETGMAKDEDIKDFAGKIHSEAGRLIEMIRDIIKLSELDEQHSAEDFCVLDLLPVAQDTAGMLEFNAEKAGVRLAVRGSAANVYGRHELLEELIYNLCDNAIRYNKPGGEVQLWVEQTENGSARLTVADTGIGIPEEHQERIFERFYRADKSRSKASGGTGLGLAIVKHIVLQHNAELSLHSEVGVGTEIVIVFPPTLPQ